MTRQLSDLLVSIVWLSICAAPANAQYGAAVVSYDAGSTPASGFTNASAAVGEPERFTGEGSFPAVVSPFNPPFLPSEIVSVGEGGQITVRLSYYALPLASGPEIGVFENVGLIDTNFPFGMASSPVGAFDIDTALVEVSGDGESWVSLGEVAFDVPTNGFADATSPFALSPGNMPSDFQQPFTGELDSFSGLRYFSANFDMQDLLAGSGGGKWLDISSTGLAQVGYIRFSVADDMNVESRLNFELDAVSIAHGAVGARIVPEPATALCMPLFILWLVNRRALIYRLAVSGNERIATKSIA